MGQTCAVLKDLLRIMSGAKDMSLLKSVQANQDQSIDAHSDFSQFHKSFEGNAMAKNGAILLLLETNSGPNPHMRQGWFK